MGSDSVAREVAQYMTLPYRIELTPDPEDGHGGGRPAVRVATLAPPMLKLVPFA